MKPRVAKYLLDILLAIEDIQIFVATVPSFAAYESNVVLQSAVERKFMVTGEALNRALREMPMLPIADSAKIIGFRNIIIHNYDELDNAIVWNAIQEKLPLLKTEVKALLNNP